MHSEAGTTPHTGAPQTWDWALGQLALELDDLVADFLVAFESVPRYPSDQVARQDVTDTAKQTFDLLIRRLRDEPDPPGTAGLIERLAARRAQQGVPLAAFLQAVRIDFRVIWLRLQRIAGESGSAVLAANVMRLLDTVEGYVDALRDAYQAEEARIDRNSVRRRHRTILQLFGGEPLSAKDMELIAERLRMRVDADYEVIAVHGEAIQAMIARYGRNQTVGVFETANALVLFREQTTPERWRREDPTVGGYVGDVRGLAAVPETAQVALRIAAHAPDLPARLATEHDVWATVAHQQLAEVFPRFTEKINRAIAELPGHDQLRLLEVVRSYLRTGSIKVTAEELFCHRNTVINRLRAFAEITGYDPTLPQDSAWILVALAGNSAE